MTAAIALVHQQRGAARRTIRVEQLPLVPTDAETQEAVRDRASVAIDDIEAVAVPAHPARQRLDLLTLLRFDVGERVQRQRDRSQALVT